MSYTLLFFCATFVSLQKNAYNVAVYVTPVETADCSLGVGFVKELNRNPSCVLTLRKQRQTARHNKKTEQRSA